MSEKSKESIASIGFIWAFLVATCWVVASVNDQPVDDLTCLLNVIGGVILSVVVFKKMKRV